MKKGDIDQEELMKEAKDIMERMNGMDGLPGMDKIKSMFGKMGVNQKQMEKGMNMMKHKRDYHDDCAPTQWCHLHEHT